MTKEEELQMMAGQSASAQTAQDAPKVHALDAIRCNPHLLWLFLSCITKYIVLFLVNGLAIYYFTYIGQNAGLLTTFVFAANLLGVVASYVSNLSSPDYRKENRGLLLLFDGSHRHRSLLCLQSDLGGYGRHVRSHVHTGTDQRLRPGAVL